MKPKNQTFAYKIALFNELFFRIYYFFSTIIGQDKRLISGRRGTKRAGLKKRGGWRGG